MLTALLLAAAISPAPFDQIVASERAFAAAAVKQGRHQAFLANLSDDAITFNPVPVPARPLHENQPPPKGELEWGPGWVAVSQAGDLAVSTGPWRIVLNTETILTKDQVQGWFISMWRRQADGRWKVGVDAGVSSPMTFAMPGTVTNGSAAGPTASTVAGGAASAKLAITAAEKAFAAAAKNGIGGAIEAVADRELRVFREGKAAAFGAKESEATLAADSRKGACATEQVIASTSGDLGYTYGACAGTEGTGASKFGFLHVWRKRPDGLWTILVDVTP